jgi:hypothetical protein
MHGKLPQQRTETKLYFIRICQEPMLRIIVILQATKHSMIHEVNGR